MKFFPPVCLEVVTDCFRIKLWSSSIKSPHDVVVYGRVAPNDDVVNWFIHHRETAKNSLMVSGDLTLHKLCCFNVRERIVQGSSERRDSTWQTDLLHDSIMKRSDYSRELYYPTQSCYWTPCRRRIPVPEKTLRVWLNHHRTRSWALWGFSSNTLNLRPKCSWNNLNKDKKFSLIIRLLSWEVDSFTPVTRG